MRWSYLLFPAWVICCSVVLYSQVPAIAVNQVGFYPGQAKIAVITTPTVSNFYLVTSGGDTVWTGTAGGAEYWNLTGSITHKLDFSAWTQPGDYLVLANGETSWPVSISAHRYWNLLRTVIKGYYYQRASTPLEPAYAGLWFRAEGHPDTTVYVHASAATAARPEGTVIQAPRGWYDAGDFNKYVVNSGISTYTLLAALEHYPDYVDTLTVPIPETDNNLPDLLDETLWNLRWMLAMQDPDDGGVYHKLTNPEFESVMMPAEAAQDRYVVQKSTPATLDFAAVMAVASRVVGRFPTALPGLADSCLTAALAAWRWGRHYPDSLYNQTALNQQFDPDIHTGEYGDNDATDERDWAAMELFITTGQDSFLTLTGAPANHPSLTVPWWGDVRTLGVLSLARHRTQVAGAVDTAWVRERLLALGTTLVTRMESSPYGCPMGGQASDFVWGSNAVAANQGMVLLNAYAVSGDPVYAEAAQANLDYLLGRNPTGYCFVTGIGSFSPQHPHHNQSEADVVPEPVPGLLVGGPNPGQQDGCTYPSDRPPLSYVDDFCSYASNEIAINWNAPLVYLTIGLEVYQEGHSLGLQPGRGSWLPESFRLGVYPNPFNGRTTIRMEVRPGSPYHLAVYDLRGKLVDQLQTGISPGEELEITWSPGAIGSGLYFIRLATADQVTSAKCVYLK
ncbi:MAG: T9SS C-terminal target domain-containing protein [Candidatus Neomarinimicrobiota bacterium]|nr:MAG: T9SS C-terminal target domain-containing protein [Candidatus Neomarinimicrobiota bacterium]